MHAVGRPILLPSGVLASRPHAAHNAELKDRVRRLAAEPDPHPRLETDTHARAEAPRRPRGHHPVPHRVCRDGVSRPRPAPRPRFGSRRIRRGRRRHRGAHRRHPARRHRHARQARPDRGHRGHAHCRRRRRRRRGDPRRRRGAGSGRPYGHARDGRPSQPPLLHGCGGAHAPDELHRAAALSRLGGHHHSHDREPRDVRRAEPEGRDRARAAAGAADSHHRAVHDREREPEHHDAVQESRAGAAVRALLGGGGCDVAEGVHDDQRRGSGGGDRRGAQAGAQGDRAPVLDQLHRGGRAGDRQHRARAGDQQRLRAGQGAGRVSARSVGRGGGGGCGRAPKSPRPSMR